MTKNIDFTQPGGDTRTKSPFKLPPAAQPPGLGGQPPLPVGKPLRYNKLTPGEQAKLEEAGWQEGEPIPSNFAALAEEAKVATNSAYDLEHMPPPGDMKTPALEMPDEKRVEDMDPVEAERYRQLMQNVLQGTATQEQFDAELAQDMVDGKPGVNEAIRAAAGIGGDQIDLKIVDDREGDTYATGTPKHQFTHEGTDDEGLGEQLCQRCGWDTREDYEANVTEADKSIYMQSLVGLVPFMKTFELYGGNLQVTLRSLRAEELDMCIEQTHIDSESGAVSTPADYIETLSRYRAALQLVAISGGELNVKFPENLKAWQEQIKSADSTNTQVHYIWEQIAERLNLTESWNRTLVQLVMEFNNTVVQLEAKSREPDFWKAIDS